MRLEQLIVSPMWDRYGPTLIASSVKWWKLAGMTPLDEPVTDLGQFLALMEAQGLLHDAPTEVQ